MSLDNNVSQPDPQAPTDPAPAAPATEPTAGGGGKDLDTILHEFTSQQQPTPQAPPPQEPAPPQQQAYDPGINARLEALEVERARAQARQALDHSVQTIQKIAGLEDVNADIIEGQLHFMAARDMKLAQAFQQRDADPQRFGQLLEAVAGEIKAKLERPDPKLSNDSAAVRHAVKAQGDTVTTSEPSNADLAAMSNQEFEAYKRKVAAGG